MRMKGLSQILFLIISASVIMMVALSLFFAFNNSFDSGGNDACRNTIQSQCSLVSQGTTNIDTPSSCLDSEGNAMISITGVTGEGVDGIDCTQVIPDKYN